MVNVQLQSRIIHVDLRDSYHRSALAKIVSHPDVAGQESICGRLRDARCRRGGKSLLLLSSGSIRRRRGNGGAQERRDKRDRKNGFHDRAANTVLDITRSPQPWFPGWIKGPIVDRIPRGTAPGGRPG
jgi:hypothetical protein